jgi:hypothetical protein
MCKQFRRSDYATEPIAKTYMMLWKDNYITPGDIIKLSESSREYRFASLDTAMTSGVTWMNVYELPSFQLKSYHPRHVRGVVRKRSFNG